MRFFTVGFFCLSILFCQPTSLFQGNEREKIATDFQLIDSDQNLYQFYSHSQSKSLVVLFFGYSHCPDICLNTLTKFSRLIESIPDERLKDLSFIFVSIDPKNDKPGELKKYMTKFSNQIIALTGDVSEIKKITKDYELVLLENPKYGKINGEGKILHSTNIYLIDKDHKITKSLPHQIGVETLKQEILEAIQ
ncbi:MAG: SCO family protein [Leptospira sp.]|nr:SCO family protein [Leptospira sp.]